MSTGPDFDPPIPTVADAHNRVHPPTPPPPNLPSKPSAEVSRGLAGTLRGFMWAAGAMATISTIIAATCLVRFDALIDVRGDATAHRRVVEQRWLDSNDALAGITALFWMLWIVVFVLLIIWTKKAHRASEKRWLGGRRWSPGWAIGGWFVPIASLWLPRCVIGEIERILDSPRADGMASPGWRGQSTSNLGWVWWFALIAGFVPFLVSAAIPVLPDDIDPGKARAFYTVRVMAFACWATSCIVGVFYVRHITRAANSVDGGERLR